MDKKHHEFQMDKSLAALIAFFAFVIFIKVFILPTTTEQKPPSYISPQQIASRIELSPEEKKWLAEQHTVVARVADFPPYHSWDKAPSGISVDYLKLACDVYGLDCAFVTNIPWTSAFEDLTSVGSFDILLTIVRTDEREKQLLFTKDYLESPRVIFTRENSRFISGLRDLRGKTIAIEKGFVLQDLIGERYPRVHQYQVESSKDAIAALSKGNVDAYIGNLTVTTYLINKYGYNNIKVAAPTPFKNHILAMGIRPDYPQLASLLDRFIQVLTPEESAELQNKWLSIRFDYGVDWGLVWKVAGVVLVLGAISLFAFGWHTRSLLKEIDKRKEAQAQAYESHVVLQCLDKLREQFILEPDPYKLFSHFLEELLTLTESEFGLVGDVLIDASDGSQYLKLYGISNLSWDEKSRLLYDKYRARGLEFHDLDNLFGLAVTSGAPVLTNNVEDDKRGTGFPAGHPSIDTFAGIPIYFGDKLVGEVGLANRTKGYDEAFLQWLSPVISGLGQIIAARWDREAREAAEEELLLLATTDSLTGIANRRVLNEHLRDEIVRIQRYGGNSVVIILDIDFFKAVNDTYGHDVGDKLLVEIVELIQGIIREIDLFVRWGGEEFVLLLPNTTTSSGNKLAERIRAAVEAHRFNGLETITISLGVTDIRSDDTVDAIIVRADKALYRAKSSGRNRVISG